MASEQIITHVAMQAGIEAAKAAIMAVREADNPVNNARPIHRMARSISSVVRQLTFDWKVAEKYEELDSFEV